MKNSDLLLSLFEKITQDFLDDYCRESDPDYLLRNNTEFRHFYENRCIDWENELGLVNEQLEQFLCGGDINHQIDLACFKYFKSELSARGIL